MKMTKSLWKTGSDLNKILTDINNNVEAVLNMYETNIATMENAALAVLEFKQTLSKTPIKSLDNFLNFYLFINTFQLDISVVLHRYLLSKLQYEFVFFGKSSALLVFEYLKTIHWVFNEFVKSAPAILQPDVDSIKIILKQFAKIKKNHPQLESIRNMIAAHRHHDSFEYLKIATEMDSYEYINLILEILKVNTSLTIAVENSLKKIDEVFKNKLSKK
jgi:hypothetical protein